MLHYNYILFLPIDYYKVEYNDILDNQQVIFINEHYQPSNCLGKVLYRLHHSRKLNNFVQLPFKRFWFPRYGQWYFSNDNPICFLFDGRYMQFDYYREYASYLKSKYLHSRCVCFYYDRMSTYNDIITHRRILPEQLKQIDLHLSYSMNDASKYHVLYYPTVYSNVAVPPSNLSESDVYFVGKAKDRYNRILAIYEQLTQKGYSCDFHITEVPHEKQIHKKGITYNQPMTYMQNLQHVVKSKYLLELMASEADGCSFRTWEAIRFNKILLTNNRSLLRTPFYDMKKCILIDDSIQWMDNLQKCEDCTPWHTQPKTPMDLLQFVDFQLSQKS